MDAIDCLVGCFEENSRERSYAIKLGWLDKGKKQKKRNSPKEQHVAVENIC
jgi:hypothetical protein